VIKRGWFVARAVIIALALMDAAASLWLRQVLAHHRPDHPQGVFVVPSATLDGTLFISESERALRIGLLAVGLMLVIAYLVVVRVSTGRSSRPSSRTSV
jgi:hypothetical protein